MNSNPTLYAQVLIPRPIEGTFTYTVSAALAARVKPGHRAIVPFGPKRYLTGIVVSVSTVRPEGVASVKEVFMAPDDSPVVIHPQLKLWNWISDYYMCAPGDVFKAAVPAGLKIESESVVTLNPEGFDVPADLPDGDTDLLAVVRDKEKIAVKELARTPGLSEVEARVMRLVDAGILVMHESLVNRYRRHRVHMVSLTVPRSDPQSLAEAFAAVKRSAGQEQALLALVTLSGYSGAGPLKAVERKALLEAAPGAVWDNVTALRKKGLVEIEVREVSRFHPAESTLHATLPQLSQAQAAALNAVHTSFTSRAVTLLHGVTGSGKTEIYIHLIDFVLRQGRQALFLVPEIALTTQLTARLQRVFGTKVRIYHSKFSDNERVDIWRDMLADPGPCVVIGARSAVFLPFRNLGLVIVDEEHEPSYKQAEPAPRYNGRDAAIVLASLHGAKTLLGSATPSVETYYKATEGDKYGLVTLTERFGDATLPRVEIVDMARERAKGALDGTFADTTVAEGRHVLRDGRQIIFFHNRRGFSPRARCRLCRFVPKCDHCDVSLTYHRSSDTLECHYCGAVYPVPRTCPECHEPSIEIEGYGTERVEDEIGALFPEAAILRMDLDTTRNKDSYSTIIDTFSAGKAQILVGTQMVTKGLDFDRVGLVGVVNADSVLHYPDFRSGERAFNLLGQVAGRAGRRKDAPGKVLIQTWTPDHPVLAFVRDHDYAGYYASQIDERRSYLYPPFARVINIYIRHRDRAMADKVSRAYAERLRELLGNRVSGPAEPPVARVASMYIRRIMLRVEPQASLSAVRRILRQLYVDIQASPLMKGLVLYYDVDPV